MAKILFKIFDFLLYWGVYSLAFGVGIILYSIVVFISGLIIIAGIAFACLIIVFCLPYSVCKLFKIR